WPRSSGTFKWHGHATAPTCGTIASASRRSAACWDSSPSGRWRRASARSRPPCARSPHCATTRIPPTTTSRRSGRRSRRRDAGGGTGPPPASPARSEGTTLVMAPRTTDFLVVGGGILGLTLALELKRRHGDCSVTLLEKEPACGLHASGRNSGVLHAGFYYTADTLKAQLTREGNRQLAAYCAERGLRLSRCGKLVVTTGPADLPGLEELLRRGHSIGVPLEAISPEDVRRIEPRARTVERALFSPCTASVDPAEVIASLVGDARAAGIALLTGTAYRRRASGGGAVTSAGTMRVGYLVNTAGLYADRIALEYGF